MWCLPLSLTLPPSGQVSSLGADGACVAVGVDLRFIGRDVPSSGAVLVDIQCSLSTLKANPTFPKTSNGFMRDQKDESPWCAFTCWHEYTSNPLDIHLHTLP